MVFDQRKFKRNDQGFLGSVSITVGDLLNLNQGGSGIPPPPFSFSCNRSRSPQKAKIPLVVVSLPNNSILHSLSMICAYPLPRLHQQHITKPQPLLPAANHTIQSRWQFSAYPTAPPLTTISVLFPHPIPKFALPAQPTSIRPIALPHHPTEHPAAPAPALAPAPTPVAQPAPLEDDLGGSSSATRAGAHTMPTTM